VGAETGLVRLEDVGAHDLLVLAPQRAKATTNAECIRGNLDREAVSADAFGDKLLIDAKTGYLSPRFPKRATFNNGSFYRQGTCVYTTYAVRCRINSRVEHSFERTGPHAICTGRKAREPTALAARTESAVIAQDCLPSCGRACVYNRHRCRARNDIWSKI
jgi:hypothetical protein